MSNSASLASQPSIASTVPCLRLELSIFDRASIEKAFQTVPSLILKQSWSHESNFRSGWAKVAHNDAELLVLTDFEDDDVFNPVSGLNRPAYEHGDICEVFWLPENSEQYAEVHTTPDGSIWQAVITKDWMEKRGKGLLPGAKVEDINVWSPFLAC